MEKTSLTKAFRILAVGLAIVCIVLLAGCGDDPQTSTQAATESSERPSVSGPVEEPEPSTPEESSKDDSEEVSEPEESEESEEQYIIVTDFSNVPQEGSASTHNENSQSEHSRSDKPDESSNGGFVGDSVEFSEGEIALPVIGFDD